MSVNMPPKPKFSKKFLLYLLISVAFFAFLFFNDYLMDDFIRYVIIFDVLPLAIYLNIFISDYSKYKLAKTNFPKYVAQEKERIRRENELKSKAQAEERRRYDQIEQERQSAIASQQNTSPWAIKYCTHPCPHCGHYKVRYAKWEDKKASIAFWGIHSSKLGANFKCEHCSKMWE